MTTTSAAVKRPAGRHLPGEEGMWVFILGDMTVFAVFFATYLYYRGEESTLFTESQRSLSRGYGVTNTVLLLTSSLCVVLGTRAVRSRLSGSVNRSAPWLFGGAMACGFGFLALKFVEYGEKFSAGITPATNGFFMFYFILTALHLFHLIIGMGVLLYLVRSSRRPTLSEMQFMFIEGGACYWHMVDLLWIVLFPLVYLVK